MEEITESSAKVNVRDPRAQLYFAKGMGITFRGSLTKCNRVMIAKALAYIGGAVCRCGNLQNP
jgi:hypothetical protein